MSFTRLGTGGAATGTSTFGAKPVASTASASTATPPQKLTYEQLDANTKKLVDEVQLKFSEKMLADEIQQRSSEPIQRVTEDSSLMIEKLQTLLGTVNQDNQEGLNLKKEYTALLRNVDQLTSLVERASAMGAQMESRQAAWDNYQLANLPSKYFRDMVGTFESRMLEYRQTIETIEKFVDTSSSIKVYTPSMLKEIMQAQMEYFLTLTAQVSQMHDGLSDLQERVTQALKDRPGVTTPAFIDPYAPKQKKEKTVPKPTFEYIAVEPAPGTGVAPATTSTFGAKTTGYGTAATGTGFGAKPTGFGSTATTGTTGFGAKPAGTGFGSSFGAKPAGTTGFGAAGAAKTGFGTPAPAKTGFGSTGTTGFGAAKPTGFGAAGGSTGFRTPAF